MKQIYKNLDLQVDMDYYKKEGFSYYNTEEYEEGHFEMNLFAELVDGKEYPNYREPGFIMSHWYPNRKDLEHDMAVLKKDHNIECKEEN
jgi:hypothetical protein